MTEGNGEGRELPQGWEWAAFSSIITFLTDYQANGSFASLKENVKYYNSPNYAVLVRLKDLRNNLQKSNEFIYTDKHGFDFLKKSSLRGGEILVANVGAGVGTTVIMPPPKQPATLAPNMFLAVLFKEIEKKYFFYYCQSLYFWKQIGLLAGGSGQPKINKQQYGSIAIQVAPCQEQKRIVEKIEELFSELDQGIENLKTAQKQLKVYRQAVLKWAFEGKLTEQWRQHAQQQGTLKTGEELLAQIKAERENRYQQQVAEWEAAVKTWEANGKLGKKSSKPSKPKDLAPLTPTELANLPQLPNGWVWVKLGNVADEPKYGTSKKCTYNTFGRGVLRIPNIGEGLVDRDDLKFAEFDDEEIQTYQLKEGDLLIIRSNGSVSLVGKCALVSKRDETFLFAGYLIRIRPHTNSIDSKYLLNCLSSSFLRNQIEGKAKSTSGVNNINSDELKSLKIPICCQLEQDQLVQEIESRLSNCDQLEQTIAENLQKAEALRQSILKQAFEGKLVPQDPNDEPAEKLLERVRAEKQACGNTGKGNQSKQRQLTLPEV